ncbi:MAG: hypothetical protein WC998_00720 [Candidatus Paceibacterota bacterium]|jgi:hypothetical protein
MDGEVNAFTQMMKNFSDESYVAKSTENILQLGSTGLQCATDCILDKVADFSKPEKFADEHLMHVVSEEIGDRPLSQIKAMLMYILFENSRVAIINQGKLHRKDKNNEQ